MSKNKAVSYRSGCIGDCASKAARLGGERIARCARFTASDNPSKKRKKPQKPKPAISPTTAQRAPQQSGAAGRSADSGLWRQQGEHVFSSTNLNFSRIAVAKDRDHALGSRGGGHGAQGVAGLSSESLDLE